MRTAQRTRTSGWHSRRPGAASHLTKGREPPRITSGREDAISHFKLTARGVAGVIVHSADRAAYYDAGDFEHYTGW
jgi:hypothetical protein